MTEQLRDKVAIVTGGSRGIGLAIAQKLAESGAALAIVATTAGRGQAAVETIRAGGGQAEFFLADVSDAEATLSMAKAVVEKWGQIDILVANAGITADNLILRLSEKDWDRVLAVNLKGAFNCIKACSRYLLKAAQGKIITITSVAGLLGNAGQANYAAAKAGLIGLTKSVARELASRHICVNAIAPGFIETEMTANLPTETKQKILANIPLARFGQPEEIAQMVLFLVSDRANYITGQVFVVDGGLSM